LGICDNSYVHAGSEFYADAVRTESCIEQVGLDDSTSGLPEVVGVPFEPPWEVGDAEWARGSDRAKF
jgi:hypothetical protein